MTKRLYNALKIQKKKTQKSQQILTGSLGINMGGQQVVEVPGRNGFVYVRLKDNLSSTVQVFNNQVSPAYNLPVQLHYVGNRYEIIGLDTGRYGSNWSSYASYLPRHGNQHSLPDDFGSGGGGDVAFIYARQFMPMMAMPSGSLGGPNLIVNSYVRQLETGNFYYDGLTGTPNIVPTYVPTGSNAVMVLVYKNYDTGNPYLLVGSGSYFSSSITGTSQVTQYIPLNSNPRNVPICAVRVPSGTTSLGWDNIIDTRQWLKPTATGSTGGGGIPDAPSDGNTYGRNNAAWVQVTSGGGGSGTPGGANTNVQYNNLGQFGGDSNFTWDKTKLNLVLGGNPPILADHDLHGVAISGTSFDYGSWGFEDGTGTTQAPAFMGVRAGGTLSSPTPTLNNMGLVRLVGKGYDGNSWNDTITQAQVIAVADGDWASSSRPTRWDVYVTASGSASESKAASFRNNGAFNSNTNRVLWENWTLPDTSCIVVSNYFNLSTFNLTMMGDSTLTVI